jgi:hypothetical protein
MAMKSVLLRRITIGATLLAVAGATVQAANASAAPVGQRFAAAPTITTGCQLGNGVQHVVELVFDNVHFARDNPNVPSDLEQMPHLLNFLKTYGTVFSNSHTPMIAHTADDSLTIYTGLYGDRHGQPLTNTYKTYNSDGSTDPATSFAYWTDPVDDTAASASIGHDTTPSMAYSASVPATGAPNKITPAPWVPFTRAGCSVGDFSTANMVLENANFDIPEVFGGSSPEATQLATDSDSFKDNEVADYVGVAVHCAQGDTVCANAQGIKNGQSTPTPTASTDALPTEPGGYHGYQALFGARYVAPQLGAGTPNVAHNGFQVTNASGNLVDENGNQINGAFTSNRPGFPGFSPTPSQTLAYMADMQEAGIPVTYGYISDMHERKAGTSNCTTAAATGSGKPIGPGDSCYVTNAQNYDSAFNTFFQRLQADGITPANTEFVISAEENDQFAGANAGRAAQPTPANCDGVTIPCNYATNQVGELQANIDGLLGGTASANTSFDIEPQGASIYVHGNPTAKDPTTRQLERDTAAMTGDNPYSGVTGQKIVKYQASALEERVLHMQTADPARLPTYTMFPVPDYYFSTTGPNVSINSGFAWNHGYYSPNIDVTWAAFAGPGVAPNGVDGPQPAQSNEAQDPNSTNTVPQASTVGTWVEEADIRPTLMHLVGLSDDYQSDGAVITAALTSTSPALKACEPLAAGYAQIESSVGEFATDTLIADSGALASGASHSDGEFQSEQAALKRLVQDRDADVAKIKLVLAKAAKGVKPTPGTVSADKALISNLLNRAKLMAKTYG